MCGGLVGDVVGNEVSHIGNLFHQMGDHPGKTLEQFALGAADPFSAKMWGKVTGQKFTPLVGQMGGETKAQYEQSKAQGVNVGPSMTLGGIADTIATIWGGYEAGGALGDAFGAGGAAAEGGGAAAEGGGAAVDSGSVNLFADAVPGAGGDVGATASGMGGAGADTAGIGTMAGSGGGAGGGGVGNFLSSVFGTGGGAGGGSGFGFNLGTAKNALGAMQVLSSLYGMDQSRKLSKKASSQAISNAGLQAVQRSMAAQGYQGSGNMMQALSRYGADAYTADLGQQQQALSNQMSGLGLLTAGFGNLAGWGGSTGGNKP